MNKVITGRVVNKSHTSGKVWIHRFTVRTEDGDYNFTMEGYCLINNGDIFSCLCEISKNSTKMLGDPIVKVFGDDDTIKSCISSMLYDAKTRRSVNKNRCLQIYNKLVTLSDNLEYSCISELLNSVTKKWLDSNKSYDVISSLSNSLNFTDRQGTLFFEWWVNKHYIRQLKLLGLTDKMIKNIDLDEAKLLDILVDNPYKLYQLDINICRSIDRKTTRTPNPYDFLCGKILRYIHKETTNNSWMCMPFKWIFYNFETVCDNVPNENFTYLDVLLREFGCIVDTIEDVEYIYIKESYETETFVSDFIIEKMSALSDRNIKELVYDMEDIVLDETQIEAINTCFNHNISIITGDPGTGKTTIIKQIVRNLEYNCIEYILCAFSGKAASRIFEATGKKSYTIHKLIHSSSDFLNKRGECKFSHVIIDEASMVPLFLLEKLIKTYGKDFSLTLVGDSNQLPPIHAGSLLNEIMKSNKVPFSILRVNHRIRTQEGDVNGILYNSQNIARWMTRDTFIFKRTENFVILNHYGKGLVSRVISDIHTFKNNNVDSKDFCILTPLVKYLKEVNSIAQDIYCGDNRGITDHSGNLWKIGDKVMVTENTYDLDLMNGEEGIILDIEDEDSLKIDFKGKVKNIPLHPLRYRNSQYNCSAWSNILTLSYMVTIHKSQGSEWKYVVVFIPSETNPKLNFYNKHLIYTAITRAKQQVVLRGSENTMCNMVSNLAKYKYEFLSKRLEHSSLPVVKGNISEDYIDPFCIKTKEELDLDEEMEYFFF